MMKNLRNMLFLGNISSKYNPQANSGLNWLQFNCNLYDSLRANYYRNISNRYPLFNNFDNNEKTLFIFNNVDPHIYRLTAAYIHLCMEYRQKLALYLWPPLF